MAVQGTFYRTETQRLGVTPVSPPNAVDDPVGPVNPPGTGVTFGGAGAGLSIDNLGKVQLGNEDLPTIFNVDLDEYGTSAQIFRIGYRDITTNPPVSIFNGFVALKEPSVKEVFGDEYGIASNFTYKDDSTNFLSLLGIGQPLQVSSLGTSSTILNILGVSNGSLFGGDFSGLLISSNDTTKQVSAVFVDEIEEFGFKYASDYSANGTLDPRWIPDWGAVTGAISGASHDPVTLGTPANGLFLVGQQLSIGLASSGVTGALSGTDWDTFNGKLNLTSPITGYTVGSNTALAATDTILQAFGKVQGQINARLSGTIASGQVAFGTAANTIGSDSGLVWNNVTKQLFIVGNVFPSFSITRTSDSFSGIEFKSGTISSQMYFGYRKTEDALLSLNNLNTFSGIAILNSGSVGVQTTSPTNTLDVNGTARIRTINNLGTAATVLLTKSATGVISERTLAEIGTDMSSVLYTAQSLTASQKNQARVNIGSTSATPQIITTAGAINDLATTSNHLVFTGSSVVLSGIVAGLDGEEITILNASGTNLELLSQSALSIAANRFASGVIVPNLSILRIKYRTTTSRWFLENVGVSDGRYFVKNSESSNSSSALLFTTPSSLDGIVGFSIKNSSGVILEQIRESGNTLRNGLQFDFNFTNTQSFRSFGINTLGGTEVFGAYADNRVLLGARSSSNNSATRRDELYLNYSQTVATTGIINDLAINADCKLLILTGADDLTGVVAVDNTRLLRIEARGASRIIRHESASSTAANRFSIGSDLTINSGEVYQFIYTDSRWRRVL